MRIPFLLPIMLVGSCAINSFALAAVEAPTVLTIRDGKFEPNQLALPSGVKLKLVVRNMDPIPAEFESYDLSREVVVPGHGETTIYIGPMDPGSYQFFNDFNHEMQGSIVAKPAVRKEN